MPASDPFRTHRAEVAPGITLVALAGAPTPDEFRQFLGETTRWLSDSRGQGDKLALVLDPSALTRFDAHLRQAYGEWREKNRGVIAESTSCAAYVAHDKLWRGILTAVFWFAKPVVPVKLCESREASIAWINETRD